MLNGLTPLRKLPKQIDAVCYNRVRLALLRSRLPLRVALAQHRGLEIILTDTVWLAVDSLAEDQPVLAWCDFQVHGRDNLHYPIQCNLWLYHHCDGLIMGTALMDLCEVLKHRG